MEFSSDGSPHIWLEEAGHVQEVTKTNGSWAAKPAAAPQGATKERFTIGADGFVVGLGLVEEATGWSARSRVDATELPLGPARP
jgi:hypothetical protein